MPVELVHYNLSYQFSDIGQLYNRLAKLEKERREDEEDDESE